MTTAAKLAEVRGDPSKLYHPNDPKREPRGFVITQSRAMGQKRGRAEGSFVRETSAQTVAFYRDIVQNLKPWQARAPKLHTVEHAMETPETEPPLTPAWEPDVAGTTSSEAATA